MELDCAIWDNCIFEGIEDVGYTNILVKTPNGLVKLSKEGYLYHNHSGSKCVIFPKGKTTWDGFHRPFVDGDIIYTKHKLGSEFVSIFQIEYERDICTYWDINRSTNKLIGSLHEGNAFKVFIEKDKVKEQRLATEEEKAKLFQAIKDNGYKWNAESKTLEKLIEPQFKVGDRIRHKEKTKWTCVIRRIDDRYWVDEHPMCYTLPFGKQDEYELVPNKFDITTLKPFDSRVLVRDSIYDEWKVSFWGCMSDCDRDYKYDTVRGYYKCCIPYESNEHLLGKTEDCDEYYKTWG